MLATVNTQLKITRKLLILTLIRVGFFGFFFEGGGEGGENYPLSKAFFDENSTFTQSNSLRAVLQIF